MSGLAGHLGLGRHTAMVVSVRQQVAACLLGSHDWDSGTVEKGASVLSFLQRLGTLSTDCLAVSPL